LHFRNYGCDQSQCQAQTKNISDSSSLAWTRWKRARGSQEQLGHLIPKEPAGTPARDQDELLGYFERWLDRQLEILLEESAPVTRMLQ
jgi:hypothetical protein